MLSWEREITFSFQGLWGYIWAAGAGWELRAAASASPPLQRWEMVHALPRTSLCNSPPLEQLSCSGQCRSFTHFLLFLHHLHYLLLNKFQWLGCGNKAEKPGLVLFPRPRGIQPLSPRATEGSELTWLQQGCPKQKLSIFLLNSKKFR